MNKIAFAIHGGAGPDSERIKQNIKEYKQGLKEALDKRTQGLKKAAVLLMQWKRR